MPSDHWNPAAPPAAECNLMKNKTINADPYLRVNNNSVRMGDEQTSTYLTSKRNICTRHDAPKVMSKRNYFAAHPTQNTAFVSPVLIAAQRQEQFATGIPIPVRN